VTNQNKDNYSLFKKELPSDIREEMMKGCDPLKDFVSNYSSSKK
jgi:hypothetical protein